MDSTTMITLTQRAEEIEISNAMFDTPCALIHFMEIAGDSHLCLVSNGIDNSKKKIDQS
jgi:hypothetical protein